MNLMRTFLWKHPGHLLWIFLCYLPFLGRMSIPLTGDQKTYINIALEMREHGSWLTPYLFGEPNFLKPPFHYWLILSSWNLFGFNLFSTLLPSVLLLAGTAYFIGEIAKILHERRGFINAGLWFASTLGAWVYGTVAQMEIDVCFFYAASWFLFLNFIETLRISPRWSYLFGAFVVAGLSAWAKSPLYSVFWVAGAISYLLITGEWELLAQKKFYAAWIVGILVGLSWFIAEATQHPEQLWKQYFVQESFMKISSRTSPWWEIWVALCYQCFPFALLVLPSMKTAWKGRRRTGLWVRFLLCWSWPPALFFTFHPYHVSTYLFILVPACALLVDWGYFRAGRSLFFRWMMGTSGLLFAALTIAVALFFFHTPWIPRWILFAGMSIGILGFVCSVRDWMRGFVLCALGSVLVVRFLVVSLGEQDLKDLRITQKEWNVSSWALLDPSRNIWNERGLLSVSLERPLHRLDQLAQAVEILQKGGGLILSDEQLSSELRPLEAILLGAGERRELETRQWWRWKRRMQIQWSPQFWNDWKNEEEFKRPFLLVRLKTVR